MTLPSYPGYGPVVNYNIPKGTTLPEGIYDSPGNFRGSQLPAHATQGMIRQPFTINQNAPFSAGLIDRLRSLHGWF